jgi:hypothetical protein
MFTRFPSRDARSAVVGAFLFAAVVGRFRAVDDAGIVFRYATNLAAGRGLVFNPGEHVEGATSLLWSLYLAMWARLGADLEFAAILTALLCLIYAAWRAVSAMRWLEVDECVAGAAAAGLLVAPGFVPALANGLEGGLFSALLAEMLYRLARGQVVALGPLGVLLFATRPEGILVAAAFILAAHYHRRPAGETRGTWTAAATLLLASAAITIARLWYFGSPIPNSVLAKSYPLATYLTTPILASGAYYVSRFAVAYLWLVIPAAFAAWNWRRTGRSNRHHQVAAASLLTLGIAGAVAARNGGDWMPGFRLLAQYAPALAVLAALGVEEFRTGRPDFPRWAFALLLVPLAATSVVERTDSVPARELARQVFTQSPIRPADEDPTIRTYRQVGDDLRDRLLRSDRVSAEAVGLLAYRLPRTGVHDPTGLLDPFVARNGRPAPPYGHLLPSYSVLELRPSVAIWHDPRHLDSLDPAALNQAYATLCVQGCDLLRKAPGWSGTIVMIRRDRESDLTPAVRGGVPVEFSPMGLRLQASCPAAEAVRPPSSGAVRDRR